MSAEDLEGAIADIAQEKSKQCRLCYFQYSTTYELSVHKATEIHAKNYYLELFNKHKKSKCKDRHGVTVDITCTTHEVVLSRDKGTVKTNLDPDEKGLTYKFVVANKSSKPMLLINVHLLHPLHSFVLSQDIEKTAIPIRGEVTRVVTVAFSNAGISYYDVPICFTFHCKGKEFHIIKLMAMEVNTRPAMLDVDDLEDSPFRGEAWGVMMGVIPGRYPDGTQLTKLKDYAIPKEYIPLLKNNLETNDKTTTDQLPMLHKVLTSLPAHLGYGDAFKEAHNLFFHFMLYQDEFASKHTLCMYNMMDVPMRVIMNNRVELRVPGLAEKRPSVLRNDILWVRVRTGPDSWELHSYEGTIAEVKESVVWISGFDPSLLRRLEIAGVLRFDVRFTLNRHPLVTQHRALDFCKEDGLLDVIFPKEEAPMPSLVLTDNYLFYNSQVFSNVEQRTAVANMVKGCSRPAPFILFGPPGTGKTVTLVEAILQVKRLFLGSYILVCAPSNSACDNIALMLSSHCSTMDLLRLNSTSRDGSSVPRALTQYCNQGGLSKKDLKKYRIIVCTLIASARFASLKEEYHFTHVFIDEAGQAVEPEALVAIGGILGPADLYKPGGQLVLAGDPKQLGPICCSNMAEKAGLGLSLLQRLMEHCPLYERGADGNYNTRYITKLLNNFRSHPSLLELPNKLFYDGELRASCGGEVLNDPLNTVLLLQRKADPKRPGHKCIFHGVIGQEMREGRSPSFFNQLEIDAVMRHISRLLGEDFPVKVKQTDIGIISPYIRQVYKLKNILEKKGWQDVEVGTTETFQGREKRVIVISTVRANRNLLDYDKKYKLGFLVNAKRFNVAMTRARSLIIVVGCPHVLELDERWVEVISQAKKRGSYVGCNYTLQGPVWAGQIIERLQGVAHGNEYQAIPPATGTSH